MDKDISKELSKAVTDAVSSVLKAQNIPHAVMQAKITIDGGSNWIAFGGAVAGTECLGGGGGGGTPSEISGSAGGKQD